MRRNAPDRSRRRRLDFSMAADLRERTVAVLEGWENVSVTHGPMYSRARVGEELRRLRVERKLSQAQLGVMVRASGARISRLEKGETLPDLALVMNILEVLETEPDLQDALISLAREANEQTWWRVSGMPARQAAFAELEASAHRIREFSLMFIPGLLQTSDYAQVRYADREAAVPVDDEAAPAGRLERQKILTRGNVPVEYTVVVDEGVLRRRTAPSEVLAQQSQHLVDMASLDNVEIRVLPLDATINYASPPLNSFALYSLRTSPIVAVVETETSEVQVTDDDQTQRYIALFERIHQAALDPERSLKVLQGGST